MAIAFIQATLESGDKVYLNPAYIMSVEPGPSGTKLRLSGFSYIEHILVQETPAQLAALLA